MQDRLSQLEELPAELADSISHSLKKNDLIKAVKTSYSMYCLFKRPLTKTNVSQLLNFVVTADYEAVKKIIQHNPALMFEHVKLKDEVISPLKYAFKVYDTYLWEIFFKAIQDDQPFLQQFLQQATEQKDHLDLTPLFSAYQAIGVAYDRWKKHEITNDEIDIAWENFGAIQRQSLPWHILREFCRRNESGVSWRTENQFKTNDWPLPGVCSVATYANDLILSPATLEKCNLTRGKHAFGVSHRHSGVFWYMVSVRDFDYDAEIFKHLFDARKRQLEDQLLHLETSPLLHANKVINHT